MTDKMFEISRRRLLAGLGTVGIASAGAGLGTSAFFSDREEFDGNSLVAGSLDMHVGFEEHYSDWSDDENDGLLGDVQMEDARPLNQSLNSTRIGLPTENASLVSFANLTDANTFLNNTENTTYPSGWEPSNPGAFDSSTNNACEYLPAGADEAPVMIDLDDVKPGDFGEVTFSFALCDNPGYVWMYGGLESIAENGKTEPELDDPDEKSIPDPTGLSDDYVELLDEVRVAMWYDDGDNIPTGTTTSAGEVDVALVLDDSGSISSGEQSDIEDAAQNFIDLLAASDKSGAVAFADGSSLEQPLTTDKTTVKNAISGYDSGGSSTNIQAGINEAQAELTGPNGRQSADNIMVVLSDGTPTAHTSDPSPNNTNVDDDVEAALEAADSAKGAGTRILSLGFGISTTGEEVLRSIAGTTDNSETTYVNDVFDDEGDYVAAPTGSDLNAAFSQIAGQIAETEEIFFQGTLREAMQALRVDAGAGKIGIPLDADSQTLFDEDGDPASDPNREAFAGGGELHHLGFTWFLPVDHANEIQTDSAEFKLGFYTEQERHNDGSGMPVANTGSGDFSQISYNKAFSMQALAEGGGSTGEIQIHSDSGGVENTTLFGSNTFPANTDVGFTAELDPAAETASLTINGETVTDNDVTDGDANAASTGEPEYPGGVPSEVDIAVTAASGTSSVQTTVQNVTLNGSAVSPQVISAQDDKTFLELTDVSTSSTVTVEGTLRFEGSTSDFSGQEFVGIDWA